MIPGVSVVKGLGAVGDHLLLGHEGEVRQRIRGFITKNVR